MWNYHHYNIRDIKGRDTIISYLTLYLLKQYKCHACSKHGKRTSFFFMYERKILVVCKKTFLEITLQTS